MIFHKLSVLGNDFVLLVNQNINEVDIPTLLDNHMGIGGDGLLLFNLDSGILKVFNKDGSRASMCGNGLKALSYFLSKTKGINKSKVVLENTEYEIGCQENNAYIKVSPARFKKRIGKYYLYDLNNKHALKIVDNIDEDILIKEARELPFYNVSHIQVLSNFEAKIMTFEVGVGLTLSCGSASIATFTLLNHLSFIKKHLLLYSLGGMTYLKEEEGYIINSSPVQYVYKGVKK